MTVRSLGVLLVVSVGLTAAAGAQETLRQGQDTTAPVPVYRTQPKYTSSALRARIQGIVRVMVEIRTDGTVADAQVVQSLDKTHGLDEEALKAAKAWRFRPAIKDGKPIPFKVVIELEFRTHPSQDDFARDAYTEGTAGLVMPKAIKVPVPKYTAEAMRAKIQGTVDVQIVVGPDGKVARARIQRSLDKTYGLDEEALAAARQATFEPGTLDGKPVPVLATLTLEFRLH